MCVVLQHNKHYNCSQLAYWIQSSPYIKLYSSSYSKEVAITIMDMDCPFLMYYSCTTCYNQFNFLQTHDFILFILFLYLASQHLCRLISMWHAEVCQQQVLTFIGEKKSSLEHDSMDKECGNHRLCWNQNCYKSEFISGELTSVWLHLLVLKLVGGCKAIRFCYNKVMLCSWCSSQID